jgi:hypothetical protein
MVSRSWLHASRLNFDLYLRDSSVKATALGGELNIDYKTKSKPEKNRKENLPRGPFPK